MIGKKRYAAALQAYRDAYYASPNVSEAMESALEAYEAVRDTKPEASYVEREKVASWMTNNGFITGHGDTIEDLLNELAEQIESLQRKLLAAQSVMDTMQDAITYRDKRIDTLSALLTKMSGYACHDADCDIHTILHGALPCDCGYSETARKALEVNV